MKNTIYKHSLFLIYGLIISLSTGLAIAHDKGNAGLPVCLEGNIMMADAQNNPFAPAGSGRVLEMNIFTGARGITVNNPFSADNIGTPVVPDGIAAPGPWKPTGVLSGGLNGHAFITSAAQHALTEFHRDGTPIKTVKLPMDDDPRFGTVPRLLGSQMMPNGNIIQNVCDANFFNAVNSDTNPDGSNASNNFFPAVYTTAKRSANSRLLVLDPETLEVIDEYSAPGDPRWTCMAGVVFNDEGMYVSMFHGAAVFVIDWKAGVEEESAGIGSNGEDDDDDNQPFKLGKKKNKAKVIRVIDMLGPDAPLNDPRRRDSLRAITFDEGGNLYATFRARSKACLKNELGPQGCNPGVFRQHIAVVPKDADYPTRTIGLDPGVNVIAGIRTNRISGPGCLAINPGFADPDACDVETLYVAASAFNPGCEANGPVAANPCFLPGGRVGEYLIAIGDADATNGSCSGDPAGDNSGCAQPIATFFGQDNNEDNVDPRMLMVIHEAFVQ